MQPTLLVLKYTNNEQGNYIKDVMKDRETTLKPVSKRSLSFCCTQ